MSGMSFATTGSASPGSDRRVLIPALVSMVAGVLLLVASLVLATRQAPEATTPTDVLRSTNDLVAFWEQRVAHDPHDTTAYHHLADGYLRRARQTGDVADYDRAEVALRASLREIPNDNADALLRLAAVRGAKHEFRDSLALVQQALAMAPDDPYGLSVLGDAQFALGEYADAARSYGRLLELAPGLSSFSRLAAIYELHGDVSAAALTWQNAISSDGGTVPENSAWALTESGNFSLLHGDRARAEDAYTGALRAYPGYVHALAGQAAVHAARGEYAEAARLYVIVTERQPIPAYVIALADVYRAMGRTEDAARQVALVRAIDTLYRANGVNTDLPMALFYADQNTNLDEALRIARAAVADRPGIDADDALAWVLYRRGDLVEARAAAEHALRFGTQQPLYLYHAGMIATAQHDDTAARGYLERALAINPAFHVLHAPEARATLSHLGGAR